jgi:ribonuclease P protein component
MGLIVPKFHESAVARNRLRRRLREIWRRHLQTRQPPGDLIVRARREAYRTRFGELRDQLVGWAQAMKWPVQMEG